MCVLGVRGLAMLGRMADGAFTECSPCSPQPANDNKPPTCDD